MATSNESRRRTAALWTVALLIIAVIGVAFWWGAFSPADSPVAQAPQQPEIVAPQAEPDAPAPQPESEVQ
jgi:hypothetical protein